MTISDSRYISRICFKVVDRNSCESESTIEAVSNSDGKFLGDKNLEIIFRNFIYVNLFILKICRKVNTPYPDYCLIYATKAVWYFT